jgi:hypothetical protein
MQTWPKQSKNEADHEMEHDLNKEDDEERSGHEADVSESQGGVVTMKRRTGAAGRKKIGKLSTKDKGPDRLHQLRLELERLEKLPRASAFAKHRIKMVTKAIELLHKAERTSYESESLTILLEKLKF